MKLWIAPAFLLILASAAQAETLEQKPIDQVCAERACRAGGYEAAVFVDDDNNFTPIPVARSPYVLEDGDILVYPGETFAVVFPAEGDNPGKPTFHKAFAGHFPTLTVQGETLGDNPLDGNLPKIDGELSAEKLAHLPPNTLIISYGQSARRPAMMLTLDHNMTRTLKLDATMFLIEPGNYDSRYTSTCPLQSNITLYESWPHQIGPMVLSNFRFLKDGDDMVCK
ncbi:hypothetical protein ABI_43060 [Asticcacaulis biprosthecium C19]|uniref:Uncharacterized protein n=1 Tax=Asticcacaulis biprosthecium C19 TaxID=715226 RepID=F4QT13_9CAUL|nr:hypothetical protein [Asticcacaulis biprosthecium]EGF89883.1 hypothetical protein ABI_43060 [Asticcacaulis biprosthecium C19]